jgi:hypothetical protein
VVFLRNSADGRQISTRYALGKLRTSQFGRVLKEHGFSHADAGLAANLVRWKCGEGSVHCGIREGQEAFLLDEGGIERRGIGIYNQ